MRRSIAAGPGPVVPPPPMPDDEAMQHTRTWTDMYGSPRAQFEGRAGGHHWLVAAPPERAAEVPAALEALDGKGVVELLVHDGLTPLLGALQEGGYRGVLIVAERRLGGGPAVEVPARRVEDLGGAPYEEGGSFPAWQAASGAEPEQGECPAASAAASIGTPVVVAAPGEVLEVLAAWMDATPHGR